MDFEALVRAHGGAVRAFLRRLLRDDALADDLAQEVFVAAHARLSELRRPGAARAWLQRIAWRRFLDHDRTRRRRAALLDVRPEPEGATAPPGLALDIASAMETLPLERRACVMLGLALGHSHAEVAAITGLPLGTVKSHIRRGTRELRAALSDYRPGFDPDLDGATA